MDISAIQLAYHDDETVDERRARVAGILREQRDADVVVLPELWAPGGFSHRHWQDRAESLDGPTFSMVAEAAAEIDSTIHAGSIIEESADGHLFNTSAVFGPDGSRLAVYRKIHRFGFGQGEPRLLEPGGEVVSFDLETVDGTVRTGLATCYDLRFPELFRTLLDQDVRLLLVPAAWPRPRIEAWELFLRARAAENQFVVVGVNTAGQHARHTMGGRSMLVAADGTVLRVAGKGEEVINVNVDMAKADQFRDLFPVLRDRRPAELYRS